MKKIPMRTCVMCREKKEKRELVRIVNYEDQTEVDFSGKKNGRGAYVCAGTSCFSQVKSKINLEHALKIHISDDEFVKMQKEIENKYKR